MRREAGRSQMRRELGDIEGHKQGESQGMQNFTKEARASGWESKKARAGDPEHIPMNLAVRTR